jgi:putative transposase
MHVTAGEFYHVFNRGNNKQVVFLRPENYAYFVRGIQRYIIPCSDLIAWCLMPNHFHFLIHANTNSVPIIKDGGFERQNFSQGIKQLLSSYTKAINKARTENRKPFSTKDKGYLRN